MKTTDAPAATAGLLKLTRQFRDWEGQDVELAVSFAKPNRPMLGRLTKSASKDPLMAMRNMLLDCVAPDDRDALITALDEHEGLAASFANEILERVGFGSLGN